MSIEDAKKIDDYYLNQTHPDFKPISVGASVSDEDLKTIIKESRKRVESNVSSGVVVLTDVQQAQVAEMIFLHDTALRHALERDGHSKSSEGALEISFGNSWERWDGDNVEPGVTLYSYVLGPNRNHYFATIERALETVQVWYAMEMSIK